MKQKIKKPLTTKEHLLTYFTVEEIGPLPANYEGQVLILNPNIVREDAREKNNLIWRANGGFGCSPDAAGRAVFATCLGDGEQARWDRHDFIASYKGEHPETVTRRQRIDAISNVLLDMDKDTLRENLMNLYSYMSDEAIKLVCKDLYFRTQYRPNEYSQTKKRQS